MVIIETGVVSLGAMGITIACIGIMLLWEHHSIKRQRWSTILSGTLVAVIAGTLINQFIGIIAPEHALTSSDHLVNLPKFDPALGLNSFFVLPDLTAISRVDVWITALTIALIASIESILSVEAVDKMDPDKRISDVTRELYAQGIGNTVSGLIGGLPITSVIVRSSANVYSGGRTRTSAFVHGITLALAVILLPGLLNMIPLACLAAVLLMVGYKLSSLNVIKSMWRDGMRQFVPFMVTLVVIVAKDILVGVGVGLLVSTFYVIKSYHRKAITCVSDSNDYLVRFNKDITFVHKALLKEILRGIPNDAHVIIDGSLAHYIDHDINELIHDCLAAAPNRGMKIQLININDKHGAR